MWLRVVMFCVSIVLLRFSAGARRLGSTQAGQSMVEYAIVAALIAIVAMAAVQALGGGIAQVFINILNSILGIGG